MQHLTRLVEIRSDLKNLKRDYKSGKMTRREYHKVKCQLVIEKLDAESLIDGLGSPMQMKSAASPVEMKSATSPAIPDEFDVPAPLRQVLERFNHLTLNEAIEFAQTVRAAGDHIMTHSGVFVPTRRRWSSTSRRLLGQWDTYMSWSCCTSIIEHDGVPGYVAMVRCQESEKPDPDTGVYYASFLTAHSCGDVCKHPELHESSPDLTNRNPIGRCITPVIFHLKPAQHQLSISMSALSIHA